MGLSSLHVCMDSSDWFQGTIQEEAAMMDSSSSSPLAISGDILTSRVPLMDNQRRLLRPQHEQAQKCPRCDSTHTKFCYYNNYSLSQPRYFCKACRRYWTKGGTLRNIPVGGGCRKNKKVSSKKPNDQNHSGRSSSTLSSSMAIPGLISNNPTHLQLSFPDDGEFSQLNNNIMSHHGHNLGHLNFMDPTKYNNSSNNNSNIMHGNNFMENKYGLSLHGNGEMGLMSGGVVNDMQYYQGLSQFGMPSSFEVSNVSLVDNGYHQRLMLPYHQSDHQENGTIDVKPNPKLLTLNWHDQTCPPPDNHHAASEGQEDNTIAYLGGLESSWLMNHGYGS